MSLKFHDLSKLKTIDPDLLPEPPEYIDENALIENSKEDGHASLVEYESRFARIYEMVLYEKLSHKEFRRDAMKEFGVSQRTADNLWYASRERLRQRFAERGDIIVEQQLARMFDLLKRCRKDGNKKVERELLADLNKIYGLEHRRIDITSNGEPIAINISIEE